MAESWILMKCGCKIDCNVKPKGTGDYRKIGMMPPITYQKEKLSNPTRKGRRIQPMFSDALLKRFDDLPDISPKEAESKYWAKPRVEYGRVLKLALAASGLDSNKAAVVRGAEEAAEAVEQSYQTIVTFQREINRMCLALGVDPDQSLSDAVDSVLALANASNDGTGETVDKTPDPDDGPPTGADAPSSDASSDEPPPRDKPPTPAERPVTTDTDSNSER